MKRRSIQLAIGVALLAVVLALLARQSYTSTLRRTYGAILPFVLELNIVDAAGTPVPQPTVGLLDPTTNEITDDPFFSIEPRANDAIGQVELRFRGRPFEGEDWRLFWLFPRIISAPRGWDAYDVQISAPGHSPHVVALLDLLSEQSGTVPLPGEPDRVGARYVAQVVLP